MLDLIRANAQSWGVKSAFGIIILVFVFWGVGGLTGGPSTVILTVNGEPITIQEFQRKYEQLEPVSYTHLEVRQDHAQSRRE